MNGAEHAQEAQHLLDEVFIKGDGPLAGYPDSDSPDVPLMLAAAQVHALLAQVQYLREIGDYLGALPVLPMRVEGDGTHMMPLRARYQRADPAEPEVQF